MPKCQRGFKRVVMRFGREKKLHDLTVAESLEGTESGRNGRVLPVIS